MAMWTFIRAAVNKNAEIPLRAAAFIGSLAEID